jgi:hypothetical protein
LRLHGELPEGSGGGEDEGREREVCGGAGLVRPCRPWRATRASATIIFHMNRAEIS